MSHVNQSHVSKSEAHAHTHIYIYHRKNDYGIENLLTFKEYK